MGTCEGRDNQNELTHLKKSQAIICTNSRIATNKHPDWAEFEIGESACKVIENQLLVEEKSKLTDQVQELKSTISAPNHEIEALKNEINVIQNSKRLCQAKQNDKIKQVRET